MAELVPQPAGASPAGMHDIKYSIDPQGDTILILVDANAPFAVPEPGDNLPSALRDPEESGGCRAAASQPVSTSYAGLGTRLVVAPAATAAATTQEPQSEGETPPKKSRKLLHDDGVCFRVSSKHLITASKYFRKRLKGPWKEHTDVAEDGSCIVWAQEWNEQALLIVMNIIHGRSKQVPRAVDLQLMAQIAVIIDRCACHEATWFFHKTWIGNYFRRRPNASCERGRDLILWLFVTIIFYCPSWFREAADSVIQTSRGTVRTWNLPFAAALIDTLNRERQECLATIAARIRVVIAHFRDSTACQNFDCSAIRYGALLKELHHRNIVLEQIEQGGNGYSVKEVLQVLRSFREPDLAAGGPHDCRAGTILRNTMASITVPDMTLENY